LTYLHLDKKQKTVHRFLFIKLIYQMDAVVQL